MARGYSGGRSYTGSGRGSSNWSSSGGGRSASGAAAGKSGSSRGASGSGGTHAGSSSTGSAKGGAGSTQRAANTRMWSQAATPNQIAALQAHGNYDGKYYSKGRAGQTIGASIRAAGTVSVPPAGRTTTAAPWATPVRRSVTDGLAEMQAVMEGLLSSPLTEYPAVQDSESWGAVPQSHVVEEKRQEMYEMVAAPAQGLSMSVYAGVLPFAFLSDVEDRNVRRLEQQFGVYSPDHVRQQIIAWNKVKIKVATEWMQAHADIAAILRKAPAGTFPDLEVAARTLLLEAFPADLEERNVRRLEQQFGVYSPDDVRKQVKGWVASRVEVATTNADFLVTIALARAAQSEATAIAATPSRHAEADRRAPLPAQAGTGSAGRPSNVVGAQHLGTVAGIKPMGATITLAPGTVGWLHISKLRPLAAGAHVESVQAHLRVGQKIEVREIGTDERGQVLLALVTK